jgi:hypothetical protein
MVWIIRVRGDIREGRGDGYEEQIDSGMGWLAPGFTEVDGLYYHRCLDRVTWRRLFVCGMHEA